MNKQELIKQIKKLFVFGVKDYIERDEVLVLVEQLDEPKKVEVSVEVSEEEAKFLETFDFNCEIDVSTALYHVSRTGWGYYLTDNEGIELKYLTEGFRDIENRKRLIKAILDGYTIKKDKRYRISMPKTRNYKNHAQILCEKDGKIFWCGEWYPFRTKFTRKEIEDAGFGEVFNSPLFEVEEVAD